MFSCFRHRVLKLGVITLGLAQSLQAHTEPTPLAPKRLANKLSLITTGQPATRATIAQFQADLAVPGADYRSVYARH